MTSFSRRYRAFTLVEVVLAIALLSLVLTMVAGFVITGIRVNTANVHQLQATYLAEEGLEMVRNIRDSNWWQNVAWNTTLAPGTYVVGFYDFGTPSWQLTAITDPDLESYLYEDTVNGVAVLTHDPVGTQSAFRRFIEITDVDSTDGIIDVSSTVEWNERGTERKMVLSTSLTDWKGGPL